MIRRFEEYTAELNDYERDVLLPVILKGMKNKIGKENAITNAEAVGKLQGKGYKISDARWRKLIHVIRVSGMLERVVASSKGYYISNDVEDLNDYIGSLTDRIEAQTALMEALKEQTHEFRTKNQVRESAQRSQTIPGFD